MDSARSTRRREGGGPAQRQLFLTGLSPGDWQCLADQPPPNPLRPYRNAVQVGQEKSADCFETRMTRRTPNHQRLGGEYHLPLSEPKRPDAIQDGRRLFFRDPGCRRQAAAGILLPASLVCLSLSHRYRRPISQTRCSSERTPSDQPRRPCRHCMSRSGDHRGGLSSWKKRSQQTRDR